VMSRTALLSAAMLLAVPGTVQAQTMGALRFGVSAGATIPIGDFGDANQSGYHFGGHITTGRLFFPGALRIEVVHNRLRHQASDANTLVTSGTVNAVFTGSGEIMAPYAIGGLGGYFVRSVLRDMARGPTATRYGNVTRFGLNGGAGLRIPLAGFDTFAEARIHWVSTDDTEFFGSSAIYVPLTFGIIF
jgi:hypothetical protein